MLPDILHHIHLRKRVHLKKEKFPSPNKKIRDLDFLVTILAVFMPLFMLPQIYKIYFLKVVDGVSPLSFSLLAVFTIPWIIYGFIHKEKPIIINNSIWLIMNLLIIFGYYLYI